MTVTLAAPFASVLGPVALFEGRSKPAPLANGIAEHQQSVKQQKGEQKQREERPQKGEQKQKGGQKQKHESKPKPADKAKAPTGELYRSPKKNSCMQPCNLPFTHVLIAKPAGLCLESWQHEE